VYIYVCVTHLTRRSAALLYFKHESVGFTALPTHYDFQQVTKQRAPSPESHLARRRGADARHLPVLSQHSDTRSFYSHKSSYQARAPLHWAQALRLSRAAVPLARPCVLSLVRRPSQVKNQPVQPGQYILGVYNYDGRNIAQECDVQVYTDTAPGKIHTVCITAHLTGRGVCMGVSA
jgi:hypothetical protein